MSVNNDLPDIIPGGQVREAAAVVQTLAQIAALRRDMIERRHMELLRDRQRQLERAEAQQQQEEREARRRAEQAERDQQRRLEATERDQARRLEMDERERRRDETRRTDQEARDAQRQAEQDTRRAEQQHRDEQRARDMAAREQERRSNRVDQLTNRADRARRSINDAINELAEAENRLTWLDKQAGTARTDLDEAIENRRPDWDLRRLRDTASRADEEARRGRVAIGKAQRRVDAAHAEYAEAVNSLAGAQNDYDAHQPPESREWPTADADFRIADPDGAAALAAAHRVAVPNTQRPAAASPPQPSSTPATPEQTRTARRSR